MQVPKDIFAEAAELRIERGEPEDEAPSTRGAKRQRLTADRVQADAEKEQEAAEALFQEGTRITPQEDNTSLKDNGRSCNKTPFNLTITAVIFFLFVIFVCGDLELIFSKP